MGRTSGRFFNVIFGNPAVCACALIIGLFSTPAFAQNAAPELAGIGNQSVDEGAILNVPLLATDTDGGDTLSFGAFGLPGFCTLTDNFDRTGDVDCSPGFTDAGTYTVTVTVTDDGTVPGPLFDIETFDIVVDDVNRAPVLAAIGDKSVGELSSLTFTATATDADSGDTLSFSLDAGAPAGAGIDPTTGAFSWTPAEIDGPGTFDITVRVTDDATAALSDFETITVTVNEVNIDPALDPIGAQTVDEGQTLSFTATATDTDIPANALIFSLGPGAPAGATITSGGVFSWTTDEADGPGTYSITVRVTDGVPNNAIDDTQTVSVTVNEVNADPTDITLSSQSVAENQPAGTAVGNFSTTDVDSASFTYSLVSGAGASGNASFTIVGNQLRTSAVFDAEMQNSYSIRVQTDDGAGGQYAEAFTITVTDANDAPVLSAPSTADKTVDEGATINVTLTASDPDIGDTLTWTASGLPTFCSLTDNSGPDGNLQCAPGFADEGTYPVTVTVTDDGTIPGSLSDSVGFNIVVGGVNQPPVLAAIGDKSVGELSSLTFTATAMDADSGDTLSFSLDAGAPAGAGIDPTTGAFSWTPAEVDGPGTFDITVRVTDDATVPLSDFETITVTVNEVNIDPALDPIGAQTVDEGQTLSFTATATDTDIPANALIFSLGPGAPAGATITSGGVFSWTTDEADGPGTYSITVRVTDGVPNNAIDDTQTVSVTVNEVNSDPVLIPIGAQSVDEGQTLNFTATATDADFPADTLTFSLGPGAPAGATITSGGVFSWTTDEADGPGTYSITVRVTDGVPNNAVDDSQTITLTVNEVNTDPVLSAIGAQSVDEGQTLNFTATATDADVPANTLTFSLGPGAPAGATITSGGVFSWTTDEADGPGTYNIAVRVSDGVPNNAVDDSETVAVTVSEINASPTAVDDEFNVTEGGTSLAGFNVLGNDDDPDSPSQVLTAVIVTPPTLDPAFALNSDGTFSYTHDGSETRSDSFTYQACDPEPLCDTATVTITVDNVNDAPVIESQQLLSTAEDTSLLITLADLTVTDVDSDPSSFVLSVGDGADYTRNGDTITPDLNFNGDLTVPVTVSDGEDASDVFNLTVTVTAVNDQPVILGQASLSTPEDTSLTILVTDLIVSDPDLGDIFPDDFTLVLLDGLNYVRAGNTITPAANFNGQLEVPATVSDGLLTSAEFLLAVTVDAENDPPVLTTPIDNPDNPILAVEGDPFILDISGNFTDVDGDTLQFAASGLPASGNLVFDPVTGVFSGTPRLEDARDNDPYIVRVTATDGIPGTVPAEGEFNLNISALDRANVSLDISVAPDPAILNDELSWTFTASNLVGPQLATNVELSGTFVGTGLTVSSTSSCTIEATVGQATDFNCTIGTLPIGASTPVVLTTTTAATGDVVAFATAATIDPLPIDPNLSDNSRQIAVGVAAEFSNGAVDVLGVASILSIGAGDMNGDGFADLVIGTVAGQPVQVYLSDGFRDFLSPPISLPDNSENEGIGLADFDNNGALDIVVANGGGQPDQVFGNDGAGNFTLMSQLGSGGLPAPSFSLDVGVADFNLDGNPDIVIAANGGNPVYVGDGAGGFSPYATPLGTADSHGVAVADFDGTGGPDIVFANVVGDSQVWLNNGINGFAVGDSLPVGDAESVTVGEFGGDTRPDLAFARVPTFSGDIAANPVLINNGSGGFGVPSALLGTSATNDILAGDVNSDGLTDLVFVNASGVHQVWTATASGFELYSQQIVDSGALAGVLTELGFTDVNDPGGLDLALGGTTQVGAGVYLNDGFGNLGRGDAVPPVLTLRGEATVQVPAGSNYVESGATAEDNIDGDISASVVVAGSVNTSIVGDYIVTYNVADFAGNDAAPLTRTVTVVPAAGTGGGGGGAAGVLMLLMLLLTASLVAGRSRCAIIQPEEQDQNQRGLGNG